MSSLSDIEKRYLEFILDMGGGYVLDYTDGTLGEFFRRYGVDIHGAKYQSYGTSKAKKLRAFWEREADARVGRALAGMLDFYEAKCDLSGKEIDQRILEKSRGIVGRLLGKAQEGKPVKPVEGFLREEITVPDIRKLPVEPAVLPIVEERIEEARRRRGCQMTEGVTSDALSWLLSFLQSEKRRSGLTPGLGSGEVGGLGLDAYRIRYLSPAFTRSSTKSVRTTVDFRCLRP